MHPAVDAVRDRIETRSKDTRAQYLEDMAAARRDGPARVALSCSNLAHVFAASEGDKEAVKGLKIPNIGIVTAYNDMLSAHQPFENFPQLIKTAARENRATAQVAGGVPAMCDGVTQGRDSMELSLFSRDVIALSAAVALTHEAFDAALMLGVCDKIAPGLFMSAARFGHLPILFAPAGPMPSGIPNPEKARVRKLYAQGQATREELLEAEAASYHAPGTCTFYGTANSNQFLLEAMGLHVPGAAFVAPNTPLRDALTKEAVRLAAASTTFGDDYRPFARIIDARSIVNAMAALNASGGSTNHALHLVAMAQACGLVVDWDDFAAISAVTPLLARIYPNGAADVNHFQAAGGTQFVLRELIAAGLIYGDVETAAGPGLEPYTREPFLDGDRLTWRDAPDQPLDRDIVRPVSDPFDAEGGLRLVQGNLGRAVVKVSAVPDHCYVVEAPARVYHDQPSLEADFKAGKLDGKDVVAVVRFQGPRANGMPELHKLTPHLSVLQDRGQKVALLTDGRMSGASGTVLAAIHVSPEAACGGDIAKIRDGDIVRIDAAQGVMEAKVPAEEWAKRTRAPSPAGRTQGSGREMFSLFREHAAPAEAGGGPLSWGTP